MRTPAAWWRKAGEILSAFVVLAGVLVMCSGWAWFPGDWTVIVAAMISGMMLIIVGLALWLVFS